MFYLPIPTDSLPFSVFQLSSHLVCACNYIELFSAQLVSSRLNSRASIRRRAEDICICGAPFSSVRFNSDTVILGETDRSKGSGTAVSPGSDLPIVRPKTYIPFIVNRQ